MTEPTRFRLRRHTVSAFVLAALMLTSACAGAFVDRRREASAGHLVYVGESRPEAPSICYNSWTSTSQQVTQMAQAVCAEHGEEAVPVKQSEFDCRLFYPVRTDFKCVPSSSGLPRAP